MAGGYFRVSIPGRVKTFYSSSRLPYRLWGLPNLPYKRYRVHFPQRGIKRSDNEADHSPASSDDVKNKPAFTSTCPYAWLASSLTKRSGNVNITHSEFIIYPPLLAYVTADITRTQNKGVKVMATSNISAWPQCVGLSIETRDG